MGSPPSHHPTAAAVAGVLAGGPASSSPPATATAAPQLPVGNLKYLSYYECCTDTGKVSYNTSADSPCPAPDAPNEASAGGGLWGNEAGINLGLSSSLPAILKAHRCFGLSSLFQIDGAHGLTGKLPVTPTLGRASSSSSSSSSNSNPADRESSTSRTRRSSRAS